MREMVTLMADRVLSAIVPKAQAGACACGPWDNHWEYSCIHGWRYERWCTVNCWCDQQCGLWSTNWDLC